MKKSILLITSFLSICSLASCNKSNEPAPDADTIVIADPLDLGEGFNEEYYPKKEDNKVPSIIRGSSTKMKIDIALDYDGTEEGWQALANEYMRLCGNAVTVNLVTGLDTASYTDRLRNEENNPSTDWDIVQGNLLNSVDGHCLNLADVIRSSKNPYAGNKAWVDVVEESAYVTDVTGSSDATYLLNTESLSTAWFINSKSAAEANITDTTPETWDDLIAMLDKYQAAGYKYPFGISLSSDSITASQFYWLLRIYGDYYFRQEYTYTSKTFDPLTETDSKFVYDKFATNQESYASFSFSYSRGLCIMLDASSPYYCGPQSNIYKDFIYQLSRLAKYIRPSAYNQSFNDVRTSFMAQKDGGGKEAPQIMLDYTGSGLAFLNAEALKNNIDFFDYPTIESDYVAKGTLTRDVGGNGGYLALFNYAKKKQQDLNKDFLKFVLSPYGQTIYYKALRENGRSPKGLTTVKNNLVIIPEAWKDFFQTDKVSFTGLADSNSMLNIGVIGLQNLDKVTEKTVTLWQSILRTENQKSVEEFTEDWHYCLHSNWPKVATLHSWKEDAWYQSNFADPEYIQA